jgi:hypothetical protein
MDIVCLDGTCGELIEMQSTPPVPAMQSAKTQLNEGRLPKTERKSLMLFKARDPRLFQQLYKIQVLCIDEHNSLGEGV